MPFGVTSGHLLLGQSRYIVQLLLYILVGQKSVLRSAKLGFIWQGKSGICCSNDPLLC